MKLITAFVQPEKLNDVKQALYEKEIFKMSVSNALGCGQQRSREPPRIHNSSRRRAPTSARSNPSSSTNSIRPASVSDEPRTSSVEALPSRRNRTGSESGRTFRLFVPPLARAWAT